jgi:retron-type reverse transcriptase
VKWINHISYSFDVTNGVRQGGVLSPLLFSVYVDELLEKLKSKGIGCSIDHFFTGALGYADDNIILICPSITGMKEMIEIFENYARNTRYCSMERKVNTWYLVTTNIIPS